MPLPFLFNFFAVDEVWSAMDMSARYKDEELHVGSLSFCATYSWTEYIVVFEGL